MNEAKQFNELRKWISGEIHKESEIIASVVQSELSRMRAMSKASAYGDVMQKMDEIEAATASEENKQRPLIGDMWVNENGIDH